MIGAPSLSVDDFPEVFQAIHGVPPFPWQARLAARLAEGRGWPSALDLPTGSGKTTALDLALFHLALEAHKGADRVAPVRIAFVVDRRIIVDSAYERAKTIAQALAEPGSDAVARMADALRSLSEDGPALKVQALRGGLPREGDWARTPTQPTILCSTVDQVGSRLLFRGYGVSDSMKPVHAGLLGADCLLLLDEAHLAAPFAQTLVWVDRYRTPAADHTPASPWRVVTLTATPRDDGEDGKPFGLGDDDRADTTLSKRLTAAKPVTLRQVAAEPLGDGHAKALAEAASELLNRDSPRTLAVVVNRVALARAVFDLLRKAHTEETAEVLLLTGRVRDLDRDALLKTHAPRLLSGYTGDSAEKPLIVVATQTIEAGADFDFDAMVTQIAPLDALRQRFGRLNRTGRPIPGSGMIVAAKQETGARAVDDVYGDRAKVSWDWLMAQAPKPSRRKDEPVIDFGLEAMAARLTEQDGSEACSLTPTAPILRPADVMLLSWTAPVPAVDPAVALFLHGPNSGPADVQIVWRADIDPTAETTAELLALVPPHAGETLAVPLWAARRWLCRDMTERAGASDMADLEGASARDDDPTPRSGPAAFRWAGTDSDRTGPIRPHQIRPGDVIVVPSTHGGCDAFGWAPDSTVPVRDLGDTQPPHRRAVRRLHPALLDESLWRALAPLVAEAVGMEDREILDALAARAIGFLSPHADAPDLSFGDAEVIRPEGYGGLVVRARRRPRGDHAAAVTEDDATGSLAGQGLSLEDHQADVEALARRFARALGLPDALVEAVALAARLHDEGKADDRFQVWLHGGDRVALALAGKDPATPLAKSVRPMAPAEARRARRAAGLPPAWRHESDSVVRAIGDDRLKALADADLRALVLWLIGTHHGHGRPLFPHADPLRDNERPGPHCLDFAYERRDWAQMFEHLKARFGPWELARLEAIVRLADHRASEAAAQGRTGEDTP